MRVISCVGSVWPGVKARRYRTVAAGFALAALAAQPAGAAEPIEEAPETVVTASRIAISVEQAGSAITVITAEDLEERQARLVSDVLRDVPGLAVSRLGAVGSVTQVRIRGAEGNHTLVLIDGIEVSDLASGEFDFGHLLAADIERIEIIRGPQSALWGADAIGGVINITTKKGGRETASDASVEGGSFGTWQTSASLRGGNERWNGALSASYFGTQGTNIARTGDEEDGANNLTLSANGGLALTETFAIRATARYITTEIESDPQDFAFPATPTQGLVVDGNDEQFTDQFFGRIQGKLALLDGRWDHAFGVAITDVDKKFKTDGAVSSRNEGEKIKLDYQTSFRFDTPGFADASHTVIFLAESEYERFENRSATFPASDQNQERKSHGFAGEYRIDLWDRLFLSGAIRHDRNSDFKDSTTYRAAAAYVLPSGDTRLHGSHSTGVTNPTFFEQFGFDPSTFVGNPTLKPEKSVGWDIGVEQAFLDRRVVLDVTYFRTDLEDEIITTFDSGTFTFSVDNQAGESECEGAEVMLDAKLPRGLSVGASYTYTDSRDPDGEQEVRRPRHVASLNVNQRLLEGRADIGATVRYNGTQIDSEFISATPETHVTLDPYTLVNLYGSYQVSDKVRAFARIENLLDEEYEEVFSYSSPGIAGYAGVQVRFGPSG